MNDIQAPQNAEPRWPAATALLALSGLYTVLPAELLVGGRRWLLLATVSALLVPTIILHRRGNHSLDQLLGYILNGMVTFALIWSLALLVKALPTHSIAPLQLMRSAGALWIANVLVFASWYWRLDAGGPHVRDLTPGHMDGAFLFPQMTMHPEAKIAAGEHEWAPNFVDYLFLAFNTSTALSPTDVPVLSRWAKALMMTQSLISLLVIALLAARVVNIL
jgi:cytosine/uracil/thiamine/allantoin permease